MYTDEAVAESRPTFRACGGSLVAVTDLTKRYARSLAVHRSSLRLRAGEVVGSCWLEGSGKTTTLRMLAGILKPDEGHGQVLGFDLMSEAAQIRERAGYMSQALSLYADLSVFENLRFRAQVYGLSSPRAAADTAIADFELAEFARIPAGRLSGGWAPRLQLAAALIHSPRLVFLDEPTGGSRCSLAARREAAYRELGRYGSRRDHQYPRSRRSRKMLFCCPSIGGKDFAAEAKNILPHPFEGKLLIHQPVVATRMAFVVDCRMREESE